MIVTGDLVYKYATTSTKLSSRLLSKDKPYLVLDRKGTAITYQDHLGKTGVGHISNFKLASSTTLPVVTDSVMDHEQAEFVSKRPLKECSDQTTPGRLRKQDTDKQRCTPCIEGEPASVGDLSSLGKQNNSITPASGVRSATYERTTDSAVPPGVTTSSLELSRLGRQDQTRGTTAQRLTSVRVTDYDPRPRPGRESATKHKS